MVDEVPGPRTFGAMATWSDVCAILSELPGLTEPKPRDFRIGTKLVAWERPLRRADLEALGDDAPKGDILGVWVPSLDAKEALLASAPEVHFTTPHFDGYPVVLVRLAKIRKASLRPLLVEAWRARAPKRVLKAYELAR